MKSDTLLHSMVIDLWSDLKDPGVFWQLSVITLCLGIAWWRSGTALARWRNQDSSSMLHSQGAQQAIARLLFPVFALVLIFVARPILSMWQKTNLMRLAIALLIALALIRTIVYVVSQLARTPALAAFERTLVALVWIGMALFITGYWVDVVELLESLVFPVGKQHVSLWTVLSSGFWVLLTLLGAVWLGSFLERRLLANDIVDAGLRTVLGRLLRALLLLAGVLIGLSLVGLDITALSVFGGALGVGIGLGLQKIASNYISGFVVLLERMVRIGDLVKVDQYIGQVHEIRTRFTVLRGGDGIDHVIPNEMLTSVPVQNFTRAGALRLKLSVLIAYQSDIDQALKLAVEAALATARVLPSPAPLALVTNFAADGFALELSFSIADPLLGQGNVVSDVAQAMWAKFKQAGISVPFPQREIRLIDAETDESLQSSGHKSLNPAPKPQDSG